jgi:hypothetical protein
MWIPRATHLIDIALPEPNLIAGPLTSCVSWFGGLGSSPPFSLYYCRTCHSKAGRELGSHFAKRREKMIKIQERRMGEMPLIKSSYSDLLPNLFPLLPSLSPDTYSGLICDRSPFKTNTQTTTQQQAIPNPGVG